MKKNTWPRFVEACAFLLVLAVVMFFAGRLVERKESREIFSPFLKDPEAYDVLFFGDSRFMNGMMPLEIWDDYGIASYNLACYGNSIPVSYWAMINALEYASPKMIVLAVDGVGDEMKVSGSTGDLHTALDFLPLTKTKIRAIEDLMYDPEYPEAVDMDGNRFRDIKWEYYVTLGKYHSRFSELTWDDVIVRPSIKKGGELLVGITSYWDYDIIEEDMFAEELGNGFAYLRRILDECREREIEVLLVTMPGPDSVRAQMSANTAGSIAEEYGVRYVDMARLDSIVDYAVDCYDEQPHLNVAGTLKVTDFLGSYIRAHYDIPDRRSDPAYEAWNAQHDAYVDEKLALVQKQTELKNILMMLHDPDFDMRIALAADSEVFYDDVAILLMHNIAREHVLSGSEYDMWSNSMYPLEGFDAALVEGLPYYLCRENGKIAEYIGAEAELMARGAFGDDAGETIVEVIDRRTGEIALRMEYGSDGAVQEEI